MASLWAGAEGEARLESAGRHRGSARVQGRNGIPGRRGRGRFRGLRRCTASREGSMMLRVARGLRLTQWIEGWIDGCVSLPWGGMVGDGMQCHHVQVERGRCQGGVLRPGAVLGRQWWGEMVRRGPSPQKRQVWAQTPPLHATCSIKWPHEKYFQILSIQKLGEVPSIYATHLCLLFSKRKWFAQNPKVR